MYILLLSAHDRRLNTESMDIEPPGMADMQTLIINIKAGDEKGIKNKTHFTLNGLNARKISKNDAHYQIPDSKPRRCHFGPQIRPSY